VKSVSILVPEYAVLSSITDTRRLFAFANQQLAEQGLEPCCVVNTVGFKKQISLDEGSCTLEVDHLISEVSQTDLIIVPAITGDVLRATQHNRHYFPWLIGQYRRGAEIASYCVGAFVVAATGVLNGKKCATHWAYVDELSRYYPDVDAVHDKIITEQNGIYSSGGGTSYWNLLLYLLEKYCSRQVVIAAAKYFLLDIGRTSQSSFMMFRGQKEHGDTLVEQVQTYIEQNYRERISIDKMAAEFSIVRRTLERRFKKATKNSIAEYIQRTKIEAAKKEIETGQKNISEVMYELDYSDKQAFKDLFVRMTGLTPVQYKRKYRSYRL